MMERRSVSAGRSSRPGRVLGLVLALGLPASILISPELARGGGSPRAEAPPDREEIGRRLKELEVQIAALRSEIASLQGALGAAPPPIAQIQELEKKVDALTVEIERLRIGAAAIPKAEHSIGGLGPAASKVYGATRGVSVGGYGEMLYENFSRTKDDATPSNAVDRLDLARAVVYFGYKFNDRTLFNSEVEYEHAVAGEGEPGETSVEFAYLDFRVRKEVGLRGGLLLVPVGYLNELHEPPVFLGARRPEVEQRIIPSTWRELGLGAYGEAGPVSYRAYLVSSLYARGFTADEGIREGRQEGSEARAADLAGTARLDYTPIPSLRIGAAGFTGRTGQGDAALPRARLTLWEAHGEFNWRGLHLRGLYARGILTQAEEISLAVGRTVGARMEGWYGELGYNVLGLVKRTKQELIPFCRYESFNTQAKVAPGFLADPANDETLRTCGVSYRPIPNIVLKLDLENFANPPRSATDQVNFALGYLF
jgi:hypothetical protein